MNINTVINTILHEIKSYFLHRKMFNISFKEYWIKYGIPTIKCTIVGHELNTEQTDCVRCRKSF